MIEVILPCSKQFMQSPSTITFEAGNYDPWNNVTNTVSSGALPSTELTLDTGVSYTTVKIVNKGFRLDVLFTATNQAVNYKWPFLNIKNGSSEDLFVFATGFVFGDIKHWTSDVFGVIPGNPGDSTYKEPMSMSGEGLVPFKQGNTLQIIALGGNIEATNSNFTAYIQLYIGKLSCLGGEQ